MASRFDNATTDVTSWDYNNNHVQAELLGGEFSSAETVLLAAGPPELSMAVPAPAGAGAAPSTTNMSGYVYPMGLIQQFSLGQSQQLQPIFEIGSSRAYFLAGKNVGTLQMGRAIYSGPSLMKVMYAYYKQNNPATFQMMHEGLNAIVNPTSTFPMASPNRTLLELDIQKSLVAITNRPGYGDFFINLQSELFKQPMGLLMYVKNSLGQPFGAGYIENAYIGSHQMSLQAGANILVEACSLTFDRVLPVQVAISAYKPIMANI